MASADFLVLVNSGGVTKSKRYPSSSNSPSFLSVLIGSDGLEIKDTANAFDFSAKELSNIADGLSSSSAASIGQLNTGLDGKLDLSGGTMTGAIDMGTNQINNLGSPTSDNDAATRKFVIDQIAASGASAEWASSVISSQVTAPPGSPTSGDRYLLGLDTGASVVTGAWAGHDGEIAQWNGAAWEFLMPTVGTFVSADDQTTNLYYFGGVTWTAKYFEVTTASTGLLKVGQDIRVKFESSNPSLAVNGSDALMVKLDASGGIQSGVSGVNVKLNGSTLDKSSSGLKVSDAGITETQLATSVAGNGLAGGAGSPLSVNVDDTGIEISTDTLQLKDLGVTSSKINDLAVTTGKLADASVDEDKLAASVAGGGLSGGAGSPLAVNVDDSSIEISTDTLQVKDLGISSAKLADLSVSTGKIADAAVDEDKLSSSVAGDGLAGGAGSALSVNVGDGMQILSDAVAADYTQSMTNSNAGSITIRKVVYVLPDGSVDLAIASAAIDAAELGIVADTTIATTASGKIYFRRGAIISGYTGLTPGQLVYVSRSAAGSLVQSLSGFVAGEQVYSVGRALSATQIIFNPEYILEY